MFKLISFVETSSSDQFMLMDYDLGKRVECSTIGLRMYNWFSTVGRVDYIPKFKRIVNVEIFDGYRRKGFSHILMRRAIKRFDIKEIYVMSDECKIPYILPLKADDLISLYSKYGFVVDGKGAIYDEVAFDIPIKCYRLSKIT